MGSASNNLNGHPAVEEELVVKHKRTCKDWCITYFWEGQTLDKDLQEKVEDDADWSPLQRFYHHHRRPIAFLLPAVIVHLFWWGFMLNNQLLHLFADRYFMSLTMVVGSLTAGMTSEGGGAVAFPVMVFFFHITPAVARDFILMIQSTGMGAASVSILLMQVQLEWVTLVTATAGGLVGIIFGFHCVDPYLPNAYKKMTFAAVVFSFAFSLFLLNRNKGRTTFNSIPDIRAWKIVVLFFTAVFGSVLSSIAGNGLDIITFSVATLLFCVSEKVATPTSVILMAINSMVGTYWRHVVMGAMDQEAFDFLYVCAPVVVLGAPLGATLGSHFHRLVLASLIYILAIVTLVTGFIFVPQTVTTVCVTIGIIAIAFVVYYLLTWTGSKMALTVLLRQDQNRQAEWQSIDNIQSC